MVSEVNQIKRSLNELINTEDGMFITNPKIQQERLNVLNNKLEEIFEEDSSNFKKDLNSLSEKYCKLENEWVYLVDRAFLSKSEIRESKSEQLVSIIARALICKKVALQHLKKAILLIAELENNSRFLLNLQNIAISNIKKLCELSKCVDTIKGYCREASLAIDDYSYFLSLAYNILGDASMLSKKQLKADIYCFQLDTAITDLFTSRTESCDVAPFLLRSRLEMKIRRLIFDVDFAPSSFLPTPKLTLTELIKACTRAGVQFNCPAEQLLKVIENLNLIIHFGFKLNSSLMWYSYSIMTNLQVIVKGDTPKEKKINLKKMVQDLFNDLKSKKFIQKFEDSPYSKSGINILWR